MQTRPIFILLGLLAAAGALAEAYTWTDENGVVHYSDRPEPGAKVVQLESSGNRRPQAAARPTAPANAENAGNAAVPDFRYERLEIASPAPEETLWNIGGTLNVTLALTPALQEGHQVRVYFDGTPRTVQGSSFQIEEVYRGVHNLQAEIVDETGKLMIRSLPNRFYVQQNSVL
ncbi:MAG TPA: DUF4124 domain-containing protein [Woeseiaceae bacterium]|nr:DUF4124 domain-containing protein [Woeseiaceae bacterium]